MAGEVEVKALLFASYADAYGSGEVRLLLPVGSTVGDAVDAVRAKSPTAIPARPLVALNERYATLDDALSSGDEVALIPPVAGG
ncbi:MAG TPA: MoaD/ThiS family protein [Gemmatimonadaceae bacterium]|nr:MoaD/ThiS family protein [Gemmatimonadaceae bacterium]